MKAFANEALAPSLQKQITQENSELATAKVPEGTITHAEQKIEARRRLEVLESTLPRGSDTHITISDLYPCQTIQMLLLARNAGKSVGRGQTE